ncbi:MAG: helix-turn-helix transcriptional regulator [Betaproteobacteria bacterium]|nr:helix-turn-helix transcriptional regulator [Betaproteobacteria bacterium]
MNEPADPNRKDSAPVSPSVKGDAAELLRTLYSAALDDRLWRHFLAESCRVFRAACAGFLLIDESDDSSEVCHAEGVSEQDQQRYRDIYHAINPRIRVLRQLRVGEWCRCTDHFDEAFVAGDRYYQEYVIPAGRRYALTGVIARREDQIITFGFWRRPEAGPFAVDDLALAQSLSLHLEGVANFQMQSARAAMESECREALDDAGDGAAWIVAADGRVLARNRQAVQMMEGVGRLKLTERNCRLVSGERRFAPGMAIAVARCAEPTTVGTCLTLDEGDQAGVPGVQMHAWKGPHSAWLARGRRPAALVRVAAPGATDLARAARRFKLSQAECEVAASLCTGSSLAEIAAARRVARSTVKTQVDSLFIKTETHSQKALVTKLLKS